MSLTKHWKKGKCLEWYTYLPYDNRPEISPVFMIQNVECYFCFSRHGYNSSYYCYNLYLKTILTSTTLKSFSVVIYINYDGSTSGPFTRSEVTFYRCNEYIFTFNESEFTSKPFRFGIGYPIRYFFVFVQSIDLTLPSETIVDEKSAQTDLMLPLRTDFECLSLDFGELLKNGKHSDVQLLCNGGSISAHKSVLAARSKVFSDMFQDGTDENKSGLVNITTTEISVMKLCLEYVYKGKILNLSFEKASDLYVLAHTFKISSLVKMCADLMIANLSKDNYITYMILADKYNDDCFKHGIIHYISRNADLLTTKAE